MAILKETADMFDEATGAWIGVVDANGKEQRFDALAAQALVSGYEIPSVTYNGAGKVSGFVSGGVAHTITYPDANTITITNALGASRTVAVNNEGRVVAAV